MTKKYFKIIVLVGLVAIVMLPQLVLAANSALEKLNTVGATNGPYQEFATGGFSGSYRMSEIIGTSVQAILGLIGTIFLVLMLYAGFNWMTARGEEEKVTKAKDTITRAIIGLIIVVGSYAIWNFIFSKLI
ncbi:MAG: hypothetical protein Q8O59_04905 [bacterium]|nr:hypothetical protein [bacterium]